MANILAHGFAYVARPTKTAGFLLPSFPKQPRQPEQFGLVSFRSEDDDASCLKHREKYGHYGIALDERWAIKEGARAVQYIRSWGIRALRFKLSLSVTSKKIYEEMAVFPDDRFRLHAFHNAAAAGYIGASEYAKLLLAYRYTAPYSDRDENEWRIVNKHPNYSIPIDPHDAIKAVSPPLGWAIHLNTIKLPLTGVRYISVPPGEAMALRKLLGSEFSNIEIKERPAAP